MAAINNDWLDALKGEFSKPYYKKLFETVIPDTPGISSGR